MIFGYYFENDGVKERGYFAIKDERKYPDNLMIFVPDVAEYVSASGGLSEFDYEAQIGVMEMKIKCPNCGKEFDLYRLKHDENNLEGFYTYHSECRASFDIDFDMNKTFITDIPKMADFKILTKEEFLESYSYLTEDEYDATALYMDWLNADDEEPQNIRKAISNGKDG